MCQVGCKTPEFFRSQGKELEVQCEDFSSFENFATRWGVEHSGGLYYYKIRIGASVRMFNSAAIFRASVTVVIL